jgi:DNA-binding transcriptional LysR family regulator
MRFCGFDLNLLVALDALLETRSVSLAAEKVHLSQPAMSSALSRLRTHFNDDLMVLVGRKLILTERGRSLREPVRDILLRTQATALPSGEFDPTVASRSFSIATSDYFSTVHFPKILRYCAVHAPGIRFDNESLSPMLSDRLDRGEIDLLIVPEIYTVNAHPKARLVADSWVCVAWNENSLIGPALALHTYFDLGHVVKRLQHEEFIPMDEWVIRGLSRKRNVVATLPQFSQLPSAIVGTNYLATIQNKLATRYASLLPLRIMPLPFVFPELVEFVQWHQYQEGDAGLQWLRRMLSEVCCSTDPYEE